MTLYGRKAGRGMAHIVTEVLEADRGVAACGCPVLSIPATSVPDGTVCPTCLAHQPKPENVTRGRSEQLRDLIELGRERISLPQASHECGLALSSLQQAARLGRLRTETPSPKVRLTTRRWLRDYLDSRPERFKRRHPSRTSPAAKVTAQPAASS